MVIDFDDPTLRIDHDHTRFDVLAEDLAALLSAALLEDGDAQLLTDAQATWHHFQEEVARHFWKEERRIFAVLAPVYPDLSEKLDHLQHQHQMLRKEFAAFSLLTRGTLEEVAAHKAELLAHWHRLHQLLHDHSSEEWEFIVNVGRRMLEDAARPEPSTP